MKFYFYKLKKPSYYFGFCKYMERSISFYKIHFTVLWGKDES